MGHTIGIDLGTTNSLACVYHRGRLETILVENSRLMPSVISILPNGQALVGTAAKNRIMIAPEDSVTSAKRVIGDGKTTWMIQGKTYTPVDVSAMVLVELKRAAEAYLGGAVDQAVITVPAYFNNHQKEATKEAARKAGLKVLRLLPEPTAAAISYGLDKGKDQTLVVYDLGGGTFDVSVLKIQGNSFHVAAVDGDFHLGGDDFDLLIVEYLIGKLEKKARTNWDLLRSLIRGKKSSAPKDLLVARQQLKEVAEKAKKELSETETAVIQLPNILGSSLDEKITRDQFNRMIEPLVKRTVEKINAVLRQAGLSKQDIDRVILVGGSTRNRLVKQMVTKALKEPYTSDQVDETVGQGAALVASYLNSPDESDLPMELENVTPFSLGVCAVDPDSESGVVNSVIINQNSPVPCSEARPYEILTKPGQDNVMKVFMLQGDDPNPEKCILIGKYIFKGVDHVAGRPAKVEIQYGYDEDGVITVSASQIDTGKVLTYTIDQLSDDLTWIDEINAGRLPYSQFAGMHSMPSVPKDQFGNAMGSQFDLAPDNAFNGYTIAVLHLYTEERFNFSLPEAALREKGFYVHRLTMPPAIKEFKSVLRDACQLWIISNQQPILGNEHVNVICDFFNSGKGVFIWGDNDPFFADANVVMNRLFGIGMRGNLPGNKVVHLAKSSGNAGFQSHLISTGIENLYEGVTIATIANGGGLKPFMLGSDRNLVVAMYDSNGKRALIDGGFTKLFVNWDTAGTGRYVKNAAAWLANCERHGYKPNPTSALFSS